MIELEQREKPTVLTSGFGRVFYASGNRVYFSRLIAEDINNAGRCYQSNDPTSDQISDLLDTDGGELLVNGAQNITAMITYRSGLLLFARNGVWYLSGPDTGFTATSYSLTKLTSNGLYAPLSVVDVGDSVLYVGDSAIHRIVTNDQGNLFEEDLTTSVIQTYMTTFLAMNIRSLYDKVNKIVWFIRETNRQMLQLDLRTRAWYPQLLGDKAGYSTTMGVALDRDTVFVTTYTTNTSTSRPASRTYLDWGVGYSAYLMPWPESLGKFSHVKAISGMTAVFSKTETQITDYTDQYVFDYPSSCIFQARWDHDNTNAFRRHTTPVNVYRVFRRGFIPTDYPYTIDDGQTLVFSKFPVSGSGTAVQFRFEAEVGKDMRLLGYSVDYKMKGRQ